MHRRKIAVLRANGLGDFIFALPALQVMVSYDSGPLHLAEALQVPSVGIYLACNIINALPMGPDLSRPVVSWTTRCPLCGAGLRQLDEAAACAHDCAFAADVEVDEVLEAVASLRQYWQ